MISEKDRPVYVISVAAELVEMHPQTLRMYERKGLIRPQRSSGRTRLYSERDIEILREIRRLTQELGINLSGVEEIMRLREQLGAAQSHLEREVDRVRGELNDRLEELDRRSRTAIVKRSPSQPVRVVVRAAEDDE
jgi:MerR family transcriptional regulator/heat shock protein HspR